MIGYIYKLSCNIPDSECYIGSTTINPQQRLNVHKNMAKLHPNTKVYKYILENGGFDNCTLEVLETVEGTKQDLLHKEREIMEKFNATLNTFVPSRTKQEWYETNREERLLKMRDYYQTHKEHLKIKMREYVSLNRDSYNAYQRAYYARKKAQHSSS